MKTFRKITRMIPVLIAALPYCGIIFFSLIAQGLKLMNMLMLSGGDYSFWLNFGQN